MMFYAFENAGKRNFGFRLTFDFPARRWCPAAPDWIRSKLLSCSKLWKTRLMPVDSSVALMKIGSFPLLASVDILMHNEGDFSQVPEIGPTTIFSKQPVTAMEQPSVSADIQLSQRMDIRSRREVRAHRRKTLAPEISVGDSLMAQNP